MERTSEILFLNHGRPLRIKRKTAVFTQFIPTENALPEISEGRFSF